jgi:hypothetical protein
MTNPARIHVDGARLAGGDLLRLERGLLPSALVEEAVETLREMMGAGPAEDLDSAVDRIRFADRARLGAVYDAFRETLIFQRIVTAPELATAAAAMIGAERIHAPFQHAVFRMDLAGEAWRGFGWHQDYAYNMLSERFVTAWLPLTPTGAHNGSIDVAPALSDRIHPVDIRFKRDAEGRRLATRDAFIAGRMQPLFDAVAEKLELGPGDVALFHDRLVHRSGHNPGPRHRFSIQVRFGDLLAPEVVARGWRNRRVDGFETFKSLHPELIETEEA